MEVNERMTNVLSDYFGISLGCSAAPRNQPKFLFLAQVVFLENNFLPFGKVFSKIFCSDLL
jgi:hypothetical protein